MTEDTPDSRKWAGVIDGDTYARARVGIGGIKPKGVAEGHVSEPVKALRPRRSGRSEVINLRTPATCASVRRAAI
jgi:hypothetical protein